MSGIQEPSEHSYSPGDRVVVEPVSAYLRRPAPGGPGVVDEVHRSSYGDYLTVTLDDGNQRHPFFHQVVLEHDVIEEEDSRS